MSQLSAYPVHLPVKVRHDLYDDEEYDVTKVTPGGTMGGDIPADRVILYLDEE